jgi:hypothetical protein
MKALEGTAHQRCRGDVSLCVPRRDAVQQQIDRAFRRSRGRSAARGLGDLSEVRVCTQSPSEDRRAKCFQVRLASEATIDYFEALGRLEEQRRGVVTASAGVHQLCLQERQLALL